jgi:hypothetical protein
MTSANKKILNASPLTWGGVEFKSKLEVMVYKTLIDEGFQPQYEQTKFVIWEGFKPIREFYDKDKTGVLKLNNKKIISITYTPDFIVDLYPYKIIIEVKGMENDVFYIKKKLFRKYMETMQDCIPIYFEIFNKRQLLQAIQMIKVRQEKFMSKIKDIKNLFNNCIIAGDEQLCNTLLNQRKWEQLKEIIDSNVYKAEKLFKPLDNPDKIYKGYEEEQETLNNLRILQDMVNEIAEDFINPLTNE